MATVYLPSGWRAATGGVTEVEIAAPRVHELLAALVARFPALARELETVTVAVDGEIYHDAEFVNVTDRSEVHLVPRVAGG